MGPGPKGEAPRSLTASSPGRLPMGTAPGNSQSTPDGEQPGNQSFREARAAFANWTWITRLQKMDLLLAEQQGQVQDRLASGG